MRRKSIKTEAEPYAGPLIYVGPSISGVLSQNTLFKDGKVLRHVQLLIEADPDLQLLIVPTSALNETRAKLKIVGTPEHEVNERLKKGV